MSSTICAQPGCPNEVSSDGGVRGYCDSHSNIAVVEAIEQLTQTVGVHGAHLARISASVAAIEDIARTMSLR